MVGVVNAKPHASLHARLRALLAIRLVKILRISSKSIAMVGKREDDYPLFFLHLYIL
jgi:hypothetical protein